MLPAAVVFSSMTIIEGSDYLHDIFLGLCGTVGFFSSFPDVILYFVSYRFLFNI